MCMSIELHLSLVPKLLTQLRADLHETELNRTVKHSGVSNETQESSFQILDRVSSIFQTISNK